MGAEFHDLLQQAWRIVLLVIVPGLAIPAGGALCSLFLGFLGMRDEGLVYAARMVVMIGVGMLCLPVCGQEVLALMTSALR
jgi:hypothetical protein